MLFHVSVRNALSDDVDALQALQSYVPECKRGQHVLPLPPPRTQNNTRFALLVGRLLPGADGSLVISHSPKHYCHIVVAPPLSSDSRAALIFCSDYRVVRCRNNRPLLEVLGAHVHVLTRCDYYSEPLPNLRSLSLTDAATFPRRIDGSTAIIAIVMAKSPIFGSSDKCFIVELSDITATLGNNEQSAVATVLFSGRDSLKWWPFVHPGRKIAFVRLKRAQLPTYGRRHIFKVSDDTTLIYSESTTNSSASGGCSKERPLSRNFDFHPKSDSRNRKRLRCCEDGSARKTDLLVPKASISPFYCSQDTITYEGVITECLTDGRVRLDDSVFLHLGGDCSWLSNGPRSSICVRVGARIEACNVSIGYQRGVATTLFPTGRTTIYFLYFGNLSESIPPLISDWHRTPWFRYWTLLSTAYALWCQELYDTLVLKFQSWFVPTRTSTCQSQLDKSLVVNQLLGTETEPGLLEFLMEKVSGEEYLFEKEQITTHFYDEFFGTQDKKTKNKTDLQTSNSFPYMPTLKELAPVVDMKWLSSPTATAQNQRSRAMFSKSSKRCVFVETFSPTDLAEAISLHGLSDLHRLPSAFATMRNSKSEIKDIILVGVIEGCGTDNATLLLHDATGAIYCECDEVLDPALIGAVVVIRNFCVTVESHSSSNYRETTFFFHLDDLQVLVDGPTAMYESESLSRPLSQSGFRKSDGSSLQITQSFDNSEDDLLENFPPVFIFVEQVSVITQHSDGKPHFTISGRLLGAAEHKDASQWMVLSGQDGQFWNCFFVVHGDAGVKIRASLEEGKVYGIACSDLKDCSNIPKLCEDRASRSRTTPHSVALFSSSTTNILWFRKLGDEDLQKFMPESDTQNTNNVGGNDDVNDNIKFGVLYQSWKSRQVLDLLSPYWKPSSLVDSSLVSFSGKFLQVCELGETELFKESECAWSPGHWSIILLERESSLFRIEVVFFDSSSKPRGLIPGSTIRVLNAKRRLSNDGRLLFTACEMTRIQTVKLENSTRSISSALCCNRVEANANTLIAKFGVSFLWNFSAAVGLSAPASDFRMCALIRVSVLELKHIEFSYSNEVDGCEFCGALDGTGRCIEARAIALVDDGSSRGDLECCTFRTVMELLGAGEEERNEFRNNLPSRDGLLNRNSMAQRTDAWIGRESDLVLKRLVHKSSLQRTVNVLVRNLLSNDHTFSSSVGIDRVTSHGHNFGYGRKLWTAETPTLHSVRLEGLLFLAEDKDWIRFS